MILNRLTRWALLAAARRWPADIREELYAEWQAEMAYLEGQPGTAGRRLGFALSLLTSPPVRDAAGVPRGWAEARSGVSPAVALMVAALFGIGVSEAAGSLLLSGLETAGIDAYTWLWPVGHAIINAAALALWCVPVAWLIGRRLPMARDGRLGPAGPAVLAPLTVLPALYVPASAGYGPLLPSLITVLGVTTWAILAALIGRAATRSGRGAAAGWLLAGIPLAAVAAAVVATVPILISQGAHAAMASLLFGDLESIDPDGTGLIVYTSASIGQYIAFGWFTVVYGRRAASAPERPVRLTTGAPIGAPADTPAGAFAVTPAGAPVGAFADTSAGAGPGSSDPRPGGRPAFPAVLLGLGLAAVLGGVLAWAYTVTYLTPAMAVMSEQAPMPGGDGEIFLWVAELRWTAVLLAAFGLVIATADRRSPARAAVLLAAGLLTTESVLLHTEVSGAWGVRIALLAAAALIAASWALAGPVMDATAGPVGLRTVAGVIRIRTTAVAITAGALGPLLFAQSTPVENHEFMPLGLPVTTVALAVGLVLLGTVTGVVTSVHRLHPAAAALLVVVPVTTLTGFGVFLGNGIEDLVSDGLIFLGLPMAVVITAVLRRHRARRYGRTTAIWTMLTIIAAPAGLAVLYAAVMMLFFVPTILFQIDATSYPADGISVIPGAALLLLPAAIWVAGRPDSPAHAHLEDPNPNPQPNTDPGPNPQSNTDPGPNPQPDADPRPDPQPGTDLRQDPQPRVKPAGDSLRETQPGAETRPEPQPAA